MAEAIKHQDRWNPFSPGDGARQSRKEPLRIAVATVALPGAEADPPAAVDYSRRRHDRVAGPFDGCRVGLLETPVRIYDLSLGGCFVNSLHEQQEGTPIVLKIDLPQERWITVKAETLYRRPGFGFAVGFVGMDDETEACLERTIRTLMERQANQ